MGPKEILDHDSMRLLGQRVQIGWVAAIAIAVLGLVSGTVIGCGLVMFEARVWLESYSRQAAVEADASVSDAQKILTILKQSPYEPCSEDEIAYLRGLVFQSPLVKDAGRLAGGKVACTATGGQAASAALLEPQVRLKDGSVAFGTGKAQRDGGPDRKMLERDGGYVLFDTQMPTDPSPIPMHVTATMRDAAAKVSFGTGLKKIGRITEGQGRIGNTLYATRCTAQGLNCATAYTTIGAALGGEGSMLSTSAYIGALAGILMGIAFSFRLEQNRELKQQLRRAAEGDELTVAYQPIVDLETRQIVGAEALARWKDEEGNEVAPDVFVKIAEEFGFVGAITKTVLRRTLHDFGDTLRERPGFRVSINVAAADLVDPEFVPMLEASLKQARVKPQNLVIELTERSAGDSVAAMDTIRTLRKLGHSIHIDDFGTGYSNLDKLLYLFADTIKIDKAFTGVIGTDSAGAAILPQILGMAQSLNLEVVVEGVETYRQADYFNPGQQKIYGQGWLYGRPVTVQEFLILLANEQTTILTSPEEASAFTTRPGTLRIVSQQTA